VTEWGRFRVQKQAVEGNDPHGGHGRPISFTCTRGLHVGRYPPQPVSVLGPAHTQSPSSLMAQAISSQTFSRMNTLTYLKPSHSYTYLPMKIEQCVPKRRHIKFRRRGITHKKAYNKSQTGLLVSRQMCELGASECDAEGQRSEHHVGNKYQMWGKLLQLRCTCNCSSLSLHSRAMIEGISEAILFFHLLLSKTD
jgi:hypothetical protein